MSRRYPLNTTTPELSIPTADPLLLEAASERKLSLFWGGRAPTRALLAALTVVAVRGVGAASQPQIAARRDDLQDSQKENLRVFDGGNCFDGYYVARLTRRLTARPYRALERVRLSRAFTCFQLAELIENAATDPQPLFVLDLLATFYDESVPLRDVERLLDRTITHLKRLANAAPVVVGAAEPRSLVKERWSLLDQIQTASDAAWMMMSPQEEVAQQQKLFPIDGQ